MPIDRDRSHLQPAFSLKVYLWLNDCRFEGIEPFLNEGLRSYERQNQLYAQGRTTNGPKVTNAKGGQSMHNFGLAVDCVPYVKGTKTPNWNFNPKSPEWQQVVKLAKNRGLAYGGDWLRFKDYPHFQESKAPFLWQCRKLWPGGWKPQ